MNSIIKKAALAAAIISTPLAASATDLFGGGASLPALAYVGSNFINATGTGVDARLSTDTTTLPGTGFVKASVNSNSLFGLFNAGSDSATYCQTGSGTGKNILLGGMSASGDCRDYSASPVGFSAPNALPDFSGSDAPLTSGDITTFLFGNQPLRGDLVQVPALGALVALPVNLLDSANNPISVDLSTQQVCGIFSGDISNWNQVDSSFPNQTITVVVRSDESGTVFATTQYFAANCNAAFGDSFVTSEDFADSYTASDFNSSVAASGNAGVVNAVAANMGSIGFANYANVDEAGQDYALINGADPGASGTTLAFGVDDLLFDTVLGDPNPLTGLPTTTSYAPNDSANAGCLAVINPAAQLDQGYPIAAVTNLLGYTNANTDAGAIQDLFNQVLAGSSSLPTGFAPFDSEVQAELNDRIERCITANPV